MLSTDNRDFLMDKYGNMVFENGQFQWSKGLAGVVQSCRIKLSMFRNEWFLDRSIGISYWQEILGKKPQRAINAIISEFFEALMSVEDVVAVTQLTASYNGTTRKLTVNWSVRTVFGDSAVEPVVI